MPSAQGQWAGCPTPSLGSTAAATESSCHAARPAPVRFQRRAAGSRPGPSRRPPDATTPITGEPQPRRAGTPRRSAPQDSRVEGLVASCCSRTQIRCSAAANQPGDPLKQPTKTKTAIPENHIHQRRHRRHQPTSATPQHPSRQQRPDGACGLRKPRLSLGSG